MEKADFTDEEMLETLRQFNNKNGRPPYMKDFKGKKPSDSMIAKRFGTWLNALKLAGLEKEKQKSSDHTKSYMINCLIEYYEKYNKVPTARGMREKGYPGIHAYINHFGSFKKALIETNLFDLRTDKHQFSHEYNEWELLYCLERYIEEYNQIPTHDDIDKCKSLPSDTTYIRRFGSLNKACEIIGFDTDYFAKRDNDILESDMIDKYINLYKILNRTPTSRDLDKYSKEGITYASKTYTEHFGSMFELQKMCGCIPVNIGRNKSREELISDLIQLGDELDRTPTQRDVDITSNMASSHKYSNEFGSWSKALIAADFEPNTKILYSKLKNIPCFSKYEYNFTNMLEKYGILFTKENKYKSYMPINENMRFDFVIEYNNEIYFVEIFGMTNNKKYEEKTKRKIELCRDNKLKLIEIYPKDFTSNRLENINRMLLSKIESLHN